MKKTTKECAMRVIWSTNSGLWKREASTFSKLNSPPKKQIPAKRILTLRHFPFANANAASVKRVKALTRGGTTQKLNFTSAGNKKSLSV